MQYKMPMVVLASVFFLGCACRTTHNFVAPTMIPNVAREMKSPGYWISRHPNPDLLVLDSSGIAEWNDHVRSLGLIKNIFGYFDPDPDVKMSEDALAAINGQLQRFSEGRYYLENGKLVDGSLIENARANIDLAMIPNSFPKIGVIVHFADQRLLPIRQPLLAVKNDFDFDELQNSALDVGTIVAVLHQTRDGAWSYVQSDLSSGWVESKNIALGTTTDLPFLLKKSVSAVVVSAKADVFLDPELTQYYDTVRMGTKFTIRRIQGQFVEVELFTKGENGEMMSESGYMDTNDIHQDVLPYTARNIIRQAFKLLNAPYGWGGMYGEQDCSRFLQEVFATVGVDLPRDSKDQAKSGSLITVFSPDTADADKLNALSQSSFASTLITMKGHIMLYLGWVEDQPYAIHATWAYREGVGSKDVVRVLNRVVVSDLTLGTGSHKGSLLSRMSGLVAVR